MLVTVLMLLFLSADFFFFIGRTVLPVLQTFFFLWWLVKCSHKGAGKVHTPIYLKMNLLIESCVVRRPFPKRTFNAQQLEKKPIHSTGIPHT